MLPCYSYSNKYVTKQMCYRYTLLLTCEKKLVHFDLASLIILFVKHKKKYQRCGILHMATKVADTFKSSEFRLQAVTARTYDP